MMNISQSSDLRLPLKGSHADAMLLAFHVRGMDSKLMVGKLELLVKVSWTFYWECLLSTSSHHQRI